MKRIAALRAERGNKLDAMKALAAKAESENRDLTAEELAQIEALEREDDALKAQIETLERIERRDASLAKPVEASPAAPKEEPQAKDPADKGLRAARIVRALAANKGMPQLAADYAAKTLGDEEIAAALSSGSGGAGGFLIPEKYASEIVELLRPASVFMSLSPAVIDMPGGNMTMSRVASGTSASYIGEQQAAPVTGMTFGQLKLSAKKLAALVPISNDLLRRSSNAADRLVRDDLVASLGQRMDLAFIRGVGSEYAPKGLRYLASAANPTNVIGANGTVNLANVTTDLGLARLALRQGNVPMLRCGWIMSPRTEEYLRSVRDGNGNYAFRADMQQGRLDGYPYRVTTQIPENLGGGTNESEIYFADFSQIVVAEEQGIVVDASSEAAYDDNGTLRAAFSRDETVIRAIAQHDMGARQVPAIAVLSAVKWGV
jgi:HK97 family phage major capsid protein